MCLDDACPKFLGFARGWKGSCSTSSTRLPFLCLAEASEHWDLAPLTLSSQSLTSLNLLIICANPLMTRSTKGAGGGTTGGDVTTWGGVEAKDFGLGSPYAAVQIRRANGMKGVARSTTAHKMG